MHYDPPRALAPSVGLPRPFTGLTLATGGCGLAEPLPDVVRGACLSFQGLLLVHVLQANAFCVGGGMHVRGACLNAMYMLVSVHPAQCTP